MNTEERYGHALTTQYPPMRLEGFHHLFIVARNSEGARQKSEFQLAQKHHIQPKQKYPSLVKDLT